MLQLVRAHFARDISLLLGSPHSALSAFSPAALPGIAYREDGEDLVIARPDGKVAIVAGEAITHWDRRDVADAPALLTLDITDWIVESVHFRGIAIQLDHLGVHESWRRYGEVRGGVAKLGDVTACELRNRTVWLTKPKGDVVQIPFRSVGTILLSPPAKPIVVEIPRDAFPVDEHTPTQPPKRTARKAS